MADNYLITGYWGEPHVTAENDRGINAAMFGTGRFVLPVGEQFKAEYIGNNTIRMYDGKLMDNGAAAGIPVGEYVDLLIANAGQGMKRNDLIVFQYSQDASTLIESGVFTVIQGEETDGSASDPDLTQEDLLSGEAAFDQMAMWRVSVSGTIISAPVRLFSIATPSGIETASNPGCYYRMVGGVKEWVNPPMLLGVEYRTTERWNGHPVYAKLITFGHMPNSSEASITWGADGGAVSKVVRYSATNDQGDVLPYITSNSEYNLAVTPNTITISTNRDKSSVIAYVAVWYTKE